MSVHISSAVWQLSQSTGSALLVLVSLADQANDEGWCWPSVGNIARRCRLGERAVQYILRELEQLGELETQSRPGRSSVYRVLLSPRGATEFGGANTAPPQGVAPGGATGDTPGVHHHAPRTVREPSRNTRGRATKLPDDWQPNDSHRERAESTDVDVEVEAEKFKAHAEANDRRQVRWDATFTTWLINAAQFQRNGHRPPTEGGSYSPWSQ